MAENSSADTAGSLLAAGVGGFFLFRLIQRMRYRAVHPHMTDPGGRFTVWLPRVPAILMAIVLVAAVALFAWLGPVAIVLVAVCVVVALVLCALIMLMLWSAADQSRRAGRYMICEMDYAAAPRAIKSTMRRIYRSAASLRSGHANETGIFGDLGLDGLVYFAAERAIVSSELAGSVRELKPDAKSDDHDLLDHAAKQIQAIKAELAEVEGTLKRSADTASTLSVRLGEPERARAAAAAKEEAEAAAADRRDTARAKLEVASIRAEMRMDLGHNELEVQVAAVESGYTEAKRISDCALDDKPVADLPDEQPAQQSTTPTYAAAANVAKVGAGKAAKFAAAAARVGIAKLKDRGNQ